MSRLVAIVLISAAFALDNVAAAQEASKAALSATATVDAFAEALESGDAAAVETMVTADLLVAEEGGAETSFEVYKFQHLPADIAFSRSVQRKIVDRRVFETLYMATVVTQAELRGTFRDKPVLRRSMETMTLLKSDGAWRIAHIHWSSAPLQR